MISIRDLITSQRALLIVGASVLVGVVLGVLLTASDFDLSPFRTLRTEHSGTFAIETRYNPLAFIGLTIIGLVIIAALSGLVAWLAPRLSRIFADGRSGSSATNKVAQKLERELSRVLELIRNHIATNNSYAKSLASAQSRLSGLPEAEQVRVIVSLLVAENERMRQDCNVLETRLKESQSQIQALRSSLSQAEEFVLKDPLTGVGNRRCFDVTMEKAIAECKGNDTPLSLIMCDIDHFKRVNDAFGHQVGDEIIKMFSRVIEASVREGDTVIRYGGEEFAIILPAAEQDAARAIAERIRHQFETKKLTIRETNQKIGKLTASFGVAQYRQGEDIELLVQRADAKLYDAKSSGRNRVAAFGSGE